MPKTLLPTLSLLFLASISYAEVKITHTQPHRMQSFAFTRFANLLGDKAATDPTRVAIFSNPKEHNGLYFETVLNQSIASLPVGTTALVEILVDADRAPRSFKFEIPATTSSAHSLYLGLTDAPFDHASKRSPHILAWKISLLDKDGKVIAEAPSATWQY